MLHHRFHYLVYYIIEAAGPYWAIIKVSESMTNSIVNYRYDTILEVETYDQANYIYGAHFSF